MLESSTRRRTLSALPNAVELIPERTLEANEVEEEVEVEGVDDEEADAEVAVLASASPQCSCSTF